MFSELFKNLKFLPDITVGDGIGWVYAAMCGIIAFSLIQHMQVKIQRHSLLYSVENEFKDLFSKNIAAYFRIDNNNSGHSNKPTDVNLRTVLGEHWNYDFNSYEDGIKQIQHDNQRYWEILNKNGAKYYLASEAFQDTLSWFRRVKKLYKDKIIQRNDLADLWRQILPFGCSGRLYYFARYFTHTKDIEPIIFVLVETLVNCHKLKMNYAVKYLIENSTDDDIKLLMNNNKFERLFRKYSKTEEQKETNNLNTIINKAN